jgi:hypothetical protein
VDAVENRVVVGQPGLKGPDGLDLGPAPEAAERKRGTSDGKILATRGLWRVWPYAVVPARDARPRACGTTLLIAAPFGNLCRTSTPSSTTPDQVTFPRPPPALAQPSLLERPADPRNRRGSTHSGRLARAQPAAVQPSRMWSASRSRLDDFHRGQILKIPSSG